MDIIPALRGLSAYRELVLDAARVKTMYGELAPRSSGVDVGKLVLKNWKFSPSSFQLCEELFKCSHRRIFEGEKRSHTNAVYSYISIIP